MTTYLQVLLIMHIFIDESGTFQHTISSNASPSALVHWLCRLDRIKVSRSSIIACGRTYQNIRVKLKGDC